MPIRRLKNVTPDIANIILGLVNLVLVLLSIFTTNYQFKTERSFYYIELFNSTDMVNNRIDVEIFYSQILNKNLDSLAINILNSNNRDTVAFRVRLATFLNFFQILAVNYYDDAVNKDIVRRNFDSLYKLFWGRMKDYILAVRRYRNDPTIYGNFERLALEFSAAPR